jgi:hypothetical protein
VFDTVAAVHLGPLLTRDRGTQASLWFQASEERCLSGDRRGRRAPALWARWRLICRTLSEQLGAGWLAPDLAKSASLAEDGPTHAFVRARVFAADGARVAAYFRHRSVRRG